MNRNYALDFGQRTLYKQTQWIKNSYQNEAGHTLVNMLDGPTRAQNMGKDLGWGLALQGELAWGDFTTLK